MLFKACIYVTLRAGVNDPQGNTVADGLRSLGFDTVEGVRVGKFIEVALDAASPDQVPILLDQMCDQLLANPVIESYSFDFEIASEPEKV